jgi:guanylate kinase
MTEEQRAHQSENELDNFENFDYTIINRQNEFDEFFKDINTMIKEIENDFTEQRSV